MSNLNPAAAALLLGQSGAAAALQQAQRTQIATELLKSLVGAVRAEDDSPDQDAEEFMADQVRLAVRFTDLLLAELHKPAGHERY